MSDVVFIGTVVALCHERIPDAGVEVTQNKNQIVFRCRVVRYPPGERRARSYVTTHAQGRLELAATLVPPVAMGVRVGERLVSSLEEINAFREPEPDSEIEPA